MQSSNSFLILIKDMVHTHLSLQHFWEDFLLFAQDMITMREIEMKSRALNIIASDRSSQLSFAVNNLLYNLLFIYNFTNTFVLYKGGIGKVVNKQKIVYRRRDKVRN